MFSVYILYSEKFDRYYKGQTSDFVRRLKEHNNAEEKSTANYIPWKLVWIKEVETRSDALKLEKKLKNITSKERIKDFIKRNSNEFGGPDNPPQADVWVQTVVSAFDPVNSHPCHQKVAFFISILST